MNKANTQSLMSLSPYESGIMHKVTMLRQTVVNGRVAKEGEVVEVSEMDARYLIAKGKAEMYEKMEEEKEKIRGRRSKGG